MWYCQNIVNIYNVGKIKGQGEHFRARSSPGELIYDIAIIHFGAVHDYNTAKQWKTTR